MSTGWLVRGEVLFSTLKVTWKSLYGTPIDLLIYWKGDDLQSWLVGYWSDGALIHNWRLSTQFNHHSNKYIVYPVQKLMFYGIHSKQKPSHTWSNKWSQLDNIGRKLFLVKITQVTYVKHIEGRAFNFKISIKILRSPCINK